MNRLKVLAGIGLLSLLLSACVQRAAVSYNDDPHYRTGGPPPHAPAHGYRHKYEHHNMVYDSRLRAYVVLGYDDHYYNDGLYFRYREGGWQFSAHLDDHDWRHADYYKVPEGLRDSKRYKSKKKSAPGKDKDHPGKGNNKDRDRDREHH